MTCIRKSLPIMSPSTCVRKDSEFLNECVATKNIIEDYVMIRFHGKKNHKLQPKWLGPRRIIQVKSPHVFIMEDMLRFKQPGINILPYPAKLGSCKPLRKLMEHPSYLDST